MCVCVCVCRGTHYIMHSLVMTILNTLVGELFALRPINLNLLHANVCIYHIQVGIQPNLTWTGQIRLCFAMV